MGKYVGVEPLCYYFLFNFKRFFTLTTHLQKSIHASTSMPVTPFGNFSFRRRVLEHQEQHKGVNIFQPESSSTEYILPSRS